jgi:hypothetical protein
MCLSRVRSVPRGIVVRDEPLLVLGIEIAGVQSSVGVQTHSASNKQNSLTEQLLVHDTQRLHEG